MTHYSPNFTLMEMHASETAARRNIDNTPTLEEQTNLRRLCVDFLEPIRAQFGPVRVTSGFRAPRLNSAIGGSLLSAHCHGRAADLQFYDPAVKLGDVMRWLRASPLHYDQLIFEFGAWLHLGIAPLGKQPRRQSLMIFRGGGYLPFDPTDPRVT